MEAIDESFPIVGIGTSAGGLEALELFLGHVPEGSGMAYIVVQHMDPTHKGMLPELLGRCTSMPVIQAADNLLVKPDHVYVIPPDKDLSILHGVLYVLDRLEPRGLRLPIDYFLRTLADDRHERSVGVILSGMGGDGTQGLRAIKECGGVTLVQDSDEAKYDSMPRNAIAAGVADIVSGAADMPRRIARIQSESGGMASTDAELGQFTRSDLDKVVILLRERTGRDFSLYKKNSVLRRIERRMSIHQLDHIEPYIRYLRENPTELDLLFKELLIGVTSFFRDPAAWKQLQDCALPALLATRPGGGTLRAWVPACSTGEAAYSLAIVFAELTREADLSRQHRLQIFATDINSDAIDKARQGSFPRTIAADVGKERLNRYFVEQDGSYRIRSEIREMITFAPQDVLLDPPFTRLDIISCRNLLIYLAPEPQQNLIRLFHYSLVPDGILFLGSAETVGSLVDPLFKPLDAKARLYRRVSPLSGNMAPDFPLAGGSVVQSKRHTVDHRPPVKLQALAEQFLLQNLVPATVLTNDKGDILYISGHTGKYLEPATGGANWNIYAMARDGLGNGLISAMRRAVTQKADVTIDGLTVKTDGGEQAFSLRVRAIEKPAELRGILMISFIETAMVKKKRRSAVRGGAPGSALAAELEEALRASSAEISSLREDMQTTQEELRSANEELQSNNEELQSSNEELTTSKEEMQSMNEELQTVNAELQAKLAELLREGSDMKNLLESTDIATVFLDSALRIRRFTQSAMDVFKLIAGDVGRPLSDIVTELDYPDLQRDVQDVMRNLMSSEKLIKASRGRWFKIRIMPYRTLENVIDGVVLTMVNITDYQKIWSGLPAQDA